MTTPEQEMTEMIATFPGFEPESVKVQPFMVPYATLTRWRDAFMRLREENARLRVRLERLL